MLIVLSCLFILILYSPLTSANKALVGQQYDVHWLRETSTIVSEGMKKSIEIYCYPGTDRNILALWQSVKFNIKMKNPNNDFKVHFGSDPEEVFNDYTENSYGWSVNPFLRKPSKTVTVDIFNTTCMVVNTKDKHSIDFHVIRIDLWRVLLMVVGITTIFLSKSLSANSLFYYLCGILVGIFASFMVLVYYVSKLLPKKTLTYGILIGGWTVGVYLVQQVWENMRSIMLSYQGYVFWYTLLMGFASFLICYRIGPPKNRRNQNLVMWTLQLVGVIMIFFSSDYQEAATAIFIVTLCLNYIQYNVFYGITTYWRRKFPPKPKLLSSEEYYEQGARETKNALDNLRQHCSSPDCAQWRIMLKLNDSKSCQTEGPLGTSPRPRNSMSNSTSRRFASFVEGESHLSDDEVMNYESYAFSPDRNRKPAIVNSTVNELEISDDDSTSDSD